jgi:hypothetical protein
MAEESGPKTSSAALDVKLAMPAIGAYSWLSSGSFRRISSAYDKRGVSSNSRTKGLTKVVAAGRLGQVVTQICIRRIQMAHCEEVTP